MIEPLRPANSLESGALASRHLFGTPPPRALAGPSDSSSFPIPRQLFFNGTTPLQPHDPFPWPALAATLETVAKEGPEAFYTGKLGQMMLEDIAGEGELPAVPVPLLPKRSVFWPPGLQLRP